MIQEILRETDAAVCLQIIGRGDRDTADGPEPIGFHVFKPVFAVPYPKIHAVPERMEGAVRKPHINLQLGMRLGEGSGCPLAFRVVEAACTVMNTMATFPEAAIDDGYLTEIRERDSFTV